MNYCKLDTDKTYIFELISPYKTIVIKYGFTELVHIGTRSNITGEEFNIDLGIKKPKIYDANSLEECIKLAEELNSNDIVKYEGFVVVDKDFHRIKVKSPEYLLWHHRLTNNTYISKSDAIDIILSNKKDAFLEDFPNQKTILLYYEWQINEVLDEINDNIQYARALYDEYNQDRLAVVNTLKNNKYKFIALRSINNNKSIQDLLGIKYKKYISSFIEPYKK